MDLLSKLKKHLDKIGLSLILLFLFYQNFSPGTWLIGWDNLMPELNIGMNIKRSFFAVWQQYQGLGLVGGMGHSADLIRQLIILPFSLFLAPNLIRYFWHFFTLAFGTFGIYFGLKKHFQLNKPICFLSSVFYLLNFGTVQNYWAPFEPFSTFWGFLPWLIFFLWEYLDKPNKKNLIKLVVLNLLAIPSFYVQTIFIVYLFCVFTILLSHLIINRPVKGDVRRTEGFAFKIIILILALNAFWLFPFGYFLKNDVQNPQLGFGNLMASQETFDRNQARGNISDFLLLRGYYYDFPDNGGSLMSTWQSHLSNPFILIIAYFLSLFVILGIVKSLFSKSFSHKKIALFIIFFICATALLSATPPFSSLNYLIRQIPILNQVFRSPFTKFIVPTIFCFTLFFAFGLHSLEKIIQKFKTIFYSLIFILIIISSFPSFTGNFFYPKIRQQIPKDYFSLINYFKDQPKDARIANLPSGSFWGWTNYRFGVRGSGFIWYGIQQPILDRAFDVWNLKNEQYYWELDNALQKQDSNILQNVLDKYSVSYLIFDNNVFFPDQMIYGRLATPTREMLDKMDNLLLVANFGQIYIYKNKTDTSISLISNPNSATKSNFSYQDIAYQDLKNYISPDGSNPNIYPFSDLFTSRFQNENKFQFQIQNQQISIKKTLPLSKDYTTINSDKNISISFDQNQIEAKIPIINSYFLKNPTEKDLNQDNSNPKNSQKIINENNQNFIRLTSLDQNNFLIKYFPEISLNQSYLVKISYRHIEIYPLVISSFADQSNDFFFNTKLESNKDWQDAWFIVPKYSNDEFQKGLTLFFNNSTFNKKVSINDIKDIEIYNIPFDELTKIKLTTNLNYQITSPTKLESNSSIFFSKVQKVNFSSSTNNYLLFPQSFHQGWIAFYFKGPLPILLKNHIIANNWENSWLIPSTTNGKIESHTIHIIFWPQILEFLGFSLIPVIFLWVNKKKK